LIFKSLRTLSGLTAATLEVISYRFKVISYSLIYNF
jgi:hypothetical protein